MSVFLLQASRLTPVQRAVRDQFERGGSFSEILVVVVGLFALVLVAHLLSRRLGGDAEKNATIDDPKALFENLLGKLGLPASQERILKSVAREVDLQHPTAILLSPASLDRAVERWVRRSGPFSASVERQGRMTILQARRALFPEPVD